MKSLDPRQLLRDMFDAAVAAAQPALCIPRHLPSAPKGRLVVIGAGKASAAMARIVEQTEADPHYRDAIDASHTQPSSRSPSTPDAIGWAARSVAGLLDVAAMVACTSSGSSALRMARERPRTSIIGMTPKLETARRIALVWGVHPVVGNDVTGVDDMTDRAVATARTLGFAQAVQTIVIAAGVPFGTPGSTKLLRVAQID